MSIQSVSNAGTDSVYTYKNGAGRSDVLTAEDNYFSKNVETKSISGSDSFNVVEILLSLVSKLGDKLTDIFCFSSKLKNSNTSNTSDTGEYNFETIGKNTCLEEDDPEILAQLQAQDALEQTDSVEDTEEIDKTNSINITNNDTEYKTAESLTKAIYEADDEAEIHMSRLCSALDMTEDEVSAYLINLTQSEQYGNGCINPLVFYAQICQESGCISDAKGDKSKTTGEYKAVGLGQFHTIAVDQVNNMIESGKYGDYTYNDGEKYTYADRTDPQKALEMMVLLLRYDASQTDDENGMLAMYNQGNSNGIETTDGKNYVKAVFSQIGIDVDC